MDSGNKNLELVRVAIKRLIEERKNRDDNDDDHLLLSRLLSQLESLKEQSENVEEEACTEEGLVKSGDNVEKEEIVKELNKVQRQNNVTHWLLSVMIVLTVAWQISEVSLFLKLKNGLTEGLTHPFKSLGGVLASMFKRRRFAATNGTDDDEKPRHDDNNTQVIPPLSPPLKIPELPNGDRH